MWQFVACKDCSFEYGDKYCNGFRAGSDSTYFEKMKGCGTADKLSGTLQSMVNVMLKGKTVLNHSNADFEGINKVIKEVVFDAGYEGEILIKFEDGSSMLVYGSITELEIF